MNRKIKWKNVILLVVCLAALVSMLVLILKKPADTADTADTTSKDDSEVTSEIEFQEEEVFEVGEDEEEGGF